MFLVSRHTIKSTDYNIPELTEADQDYGASSGDATPHGLQLARVEEGAQLRALALAHKVLDVGHGPRRVRQRRLRMRHRAVLALVVLQLAVV